MELFFCLDLKKMWGACGYACGITRNFQEDKLDNNGNPGNNATTVSLNTPIYLFSRKGYGCFGINCLYRIQIDLGHLIALMFYLKQFYSVSVAKKLPTIMH